VAGKPARPMKNRAACPFSTRIAPRCSRRSTFTILGSSGWRMRQRTQVALSRSSIVSGWSWQSLPASHLLRRDDKRCAGGNGGLSVAPWSRPPHARSSRTRRRRAAARHGTRWRPAGSLLAFSAARRMPARAVCTIPRRKCRIFALYPATGREIIAPAGDLQIFHLSARRVHHAPIQPIFSRSRPIFSTAAA
jgi:hypothetical protein